MTNNLKDLISIAQEHGEVDDYNAIDYWLIEQGWHGATGPLTKVPACFILYRWAKQNKAIKSFTYINKRVVYNSLLLKHTKKVRMNMKPYNPTAFMLPESLFGKLTRHHIIEAAAWLQIQKQNAKKLRSTVYRRVNTRKLNRNILIKTTSTN